jgi:hypothetical protein
MVKMVDSMRLLAATSAGLLGKATRFGRFFSFLE